MRGIKEEEVSFRDSGGGGGGRRRKDFYKTSIKAGHSIKC